MHCKETAEGNLGLRRVKCQHEACPIPKDPSGDRGEGCRGRQVPVRHRPREFTNVYRTSDDVPVSSKVEQHEAQVRARQFQETVKLHDSDVAAPSCGFCCWNEGTCDITCKECRYVSGPKAPRDVSRFPSIATAAPKAGVSWLVDSGSESDLVSKGMLKDVSAKNCRAAEHPISLVTANGSTEASEVADVKLPALPDPVQPYVLNHTPAVLSVGTRCVNQGYSFVWPANGKPIKLSSSRSKVMSRFWKTLARSIPKSNFRRIST